MTSMPRAALTLATALAALALPSAASAATVSLNIGDDEDGTTITYAAAAGEANKLDVKVMGQTAEISDPGANITPGANCTPVNPKRVTCTTTRPKIDAFVATLLDGNDTADIAGVFSRVEAGPGNDELNGGEDSDVFNGGGGTDTLRGNGGIDSLSDGDTTGAANKDTLDGGSGEDSAVYETRTAQVVVDLADNAGDGEAGENDTLIAIDNASGGSGNDILRGSDGINALAGGSGNDELNGRGHDDLLVGEAGDDTLIGGAGVDDLEAQDGNDVLRLDNPAGQYDKVISCGEGKDTVVGVQVAPSLPITCEIGDWGFGFVASPTPSKVTSTTVTLRIPCPDVYKRDGRCTGSIVVEPKSAYRRTDAERKKSRYGVRKFSISKKSSVAITLNSAGRKQLKKSAFKLQFQVNMKETATKTKRRFEWTSYVVKSFL
jgi:hypothetical protein